MSSIVQSTVSTSDKRVLTQKEHQSLIRKLQRGEVESTMRSLKNYRLDYTIEESLEVLDILDSLCDRSRIGIIVEWTLRQLKNEVLERKIKPISYHYEPVKVNDKPPARRPHKKAQSLRLDFLQYQIRQKILSDPEAYKDEREEEYQLSLMESNESLVSTSLIDEESTEDECSTDSFDVYCDRRDFICFIDL